jgi:hypothetical protein
MAAERLTQNPHLEAIPDHAGPHYDPVRTILVNAGQTEEQAIQTLNTTWTQQHDDRVQAWDQQVAEDARIQEEEQRAIQELEDQQRAHRDLELANEQRELERKRPKMNDFNENAMVSDFLEPRPSPYALRRLEDFEYVELWYFTQEGCADAAQNQRTQNEDTFGLTKIDDMVTLRPVAALKASKNVTPDIELTWRQMEIAKTILIRQISKCCWPDKSITALAQFFMNLEVHQYRQRAFGEQALLVYQARVRRDWHDLLKRGDGNTFNIALMNETLLQSIHREIMDKRQAESIEEVSLSFNPLLNIANHNFPLFSYIYIAPCTTYHAPRTTHHAPHTTQHAPRTIPCATHRCEHFAIVTPILPPEQVKRIICGT